MVADPQLYPFEGKTYDHKGLKLHYLDEGSGETVVMLHGNPTWSFYYRNLVLALRDNYRCIVPDHIGCGLSDKPGDDAYDYTLKSRVDDVEALLDHLDLRADITLVLHDWGGMIGMAFASRYPERIRRLVILNTAAFTLPETKRFPAALWLVRNTPIGSFLVRGFNAFSGVASYVCCKRKPMSRALRKAYRAPYNSWANRIATLRFVQDIPLKPGDKAWDIVADVEAGLSRFSDKPMLICWGEKDFVFSNHFRDEWMRHFPDAQLHSRPDCGHYILEDADDEVIPLIKTFLAERS
ncbi:MAG: alpha/beta fold hydrolase [Acidobacteriota bacterium]|nr:alpha/beta fold hydrolase [Acidobacteriota bacterium]